MNTAFLLSRLGLATIFSVAAITKVLQIRTFVGSLEGFGVPGALAAPLARLIPAAELAVAITLLLASTARWGAVGAVLLLVTFGLAMAVSLVRGETPDCNCFGQLHSTPVSWRMVGRNAVLAGIAAFVAAGGERPGPSAVSWVLAVSTGEAAILGAAVIVMALLAAALVIARRLVAQQTAMLERLEGVRKLLVDDDEEGGDERSAGRPVERKDAVAPAEGLPVGAPAPGFSLERLGGGTTTLEDLLALGKPVLLLFVSPSCRPCKALLPYTRGWERDYTDHLTMALVSKGTPEENERRIARYGARHLLLQGESTVATDYQASWTPAAVIIGRDGKLATKTTYGDLGIRALVDHAVTTGVGLGDVTSHVAPVTLGKSLFKIGELAPRFSLPDLDGRDVQLDRLVSGGTCLLLFWDPGCRFCQAMSEDLHAWERQPPQGAPQLAIIASGDPDKMRAQRADFASPILVDDGFEVASLYGAASTPSGVLIDAAGRVASSLAVGARNVLALAGVQRVAQPAVARQRSRSVETAQVAGRSAHEVAGDA